MSYYPELMQRTIALRAAGETAATIARRLTEEGWRPLQGQGAWTNAKVVRLLNQPEAASLKQVRTPISQGGPKEADEWTTRELAEQLGMARDSLHNWVQKGVVRGRKVTQHGRSIWLLWADESELARLREMRDFPSYGTHPPRIERDTPGDSETTAKKHEENTDSACQHSTQDLL